MAAVLLQYCPSTPYEITRKDQTQVVREEHRQEFRHKLQPG